MLFIFLNIGLTKTLIFHFCVTGLGGSSGRSAVADVSRLSPAKDGTLPQKCKASFNAQGLRIAHVHFPMFKMNWNESQCGSTIISRFFQVDSQFAVY